MFADYIIITNEYRHIIGIELERMDVRNGTTKDEYTHKTDIELACK